MRFRSSSGRRLAALVCAFLITLLTGCGSGDVAGGTSLGLPPNPVSTTSTLQVQLSFPSGTAKTASAAAPSFARTARVTVTLLDPTTHRPVVTPVTQDRPNGATQMTVSFPGLTAGTYLVYVQCFDANGVSCGDTVPRATAVSGETVVVPVTATLQLVSVAVTPFEAVVSVGGTQQFTATATYADSSTQDATYVATWSAANATIVKVASARANVASIDPATGLASGLAEGFADVFATVSGITSPRALLDVTGASPTPSFAYVTCYGSSSVAVIDANTRTVAATIANLTGAYGIAIDQSGSTLCVTRRDEDSVSLISTATNTVTGAPVPLPTPSGGLRNAPVAVALTPDGTRAYIADNTSGAVSVIDPSTASVIGSLIPVGLGPTGLAFNPSDATRLYVTNASGGSVSVIDSNTNTVITTITDNSLASPFSVAFSPDGLRAYVTNVNSGTVSVIDTDINSGTCNLVINTIPVGLLPKGIAISPDGSRAYVANSGSDSVSVIDLANSSVATTIGTGFSGPLAIAVHPSGTSVYVTNTGNNTVSVIDASSNSVVGTPIPVGNSPVGIVFR